MTPQFIAKEIRRLVDKQLELEDKCRAIRWDASITQDTKEEMIKVCENKIYTLETHICLLFDQKENAKF